MMSDIQMLPQGEGCQCADCRAQRGDTQFAEFMGLFQNFLDTLPRRLFDE